MHIVCYLQYRDRVMCAGRFEQRPVDHNGRLFMIHAQSFSLLRELFTFHKKRKIAGVRMPKFVRVAVQRTVKISILNHGEQQTFRDGNQDGVVCGQEFRSGLEGERLDFDSREVIAREILLVFKCRSVSQQHGGVRPDAPDQ